MVTRLEGRKKLGLAVASFLVFAATLIILIQEGTKKTVAVTLDGEKIMVKTHAETIGDMLNELEVDVKDTDYLSHAPETVLKNEQTLVWEPAKHVSLTLGEDSKTVWTTAETVNQLLNEQEIKLNKHDEINISPDKKILSNMSIEIEKAFPVVLKNGKEKEKVWSTSTTVADLLRQQEIELGKWDRVEPGLDKMVSAGQAVHVIRVEKVTDVVEEPIDYKTVTKKDSNLAAGTEKVIEEGRQGLVKKEYEITKENGIEVKRKLISKEKVEDGKDRVVAVGTKVIAAQKPAKAGGTANPNSNSPQTAQAKQGGKEITMNATAYTADCNGCSGITATGINLKSNPNAKVVAVDPSVIPLGSKVWVEGYGYAVAGDTGGAIKGNRIDLHVQSKGQANNFGRKQVKVRIID